MTQNEFYRQIAEQTGEDYQTIERIGFTPVVPRHRFSSRRHRYSKRRKKQIATPLASIPAATNIVRTPETSIL